MEGVTYMFFKRSNQDESKKVLSNFKRSIKRIQFVFVFTLLFSGVAAHSSFANEDETEDLFTVFHIYSKGEYIGVISNEEKLEKMKEDEIQKTSSKFQDLPLIIGTDLSVIPEMVFTPVTDDGDVEVLEKIQTMLSVEAEAVGVSIDGELAFYVKDMDTYYELIRKLKMQFVTEKELNEFEARSASSEPIPPLNENETRIANINISGNIEVTDGETEPEKVKNVEQAIAHLKKGKLVQKKYNVISGDLLGAIAADNDITTAKLLELNPGMTDETILRAGDELNVTAIEPYVEVEVHYETKEREAIKQESKIEEDNSVFKGEKKVIAKGSDGEKVVTELIRKRSGQIIGKSVTEERVISEAIDKVTVVGTKVIPSRGSGTFIRPVSGGYISSKMGTRWGRTHQGIDFARPSSYEIVASDNGVVTTSGKHSTYGNRVVITHNNGYETLYAHLSSIDVKVGQTVSQGTKIGVMGSTGRSTGVHLHFEVFKDGSNINPLNVLR